VKRKRPAISASVDARAVKYSELRAPGRFDRQPVHAAFPIPCRANSATGKLS
jgi:hypothetical protein